MRRIVSYLNLSYVLLTYQSVTKHPVASTRPTTTSNLMRSLVMCRYVPSACTSKFLSRARIFCGVAETKKTIPPTHIDATPMRRVQLVRARGRQPTGHTDERRQRAKESADKTCRRRIECWQTPRRPAPPRLWLHLKQNQRIRYVDPM